MPLPIMGESRPGRGRPAGAALARVLEVMGLVAAGFRAFVPFTSKPLDRSKQSSDRMTGRRQPLLSPQVKTSGRGAITVYSALGPGQI
ncbi:MAG: hypothetical protein OEW21_02855 [Betaproteobacteria bacterium]|nr:hypothetical protein [Betaproteobacteria bacterium]